MVMAQPPESALTLASVLERELLPSYLVRGVPSPFQFLLLPPPPPPLKTSTALEQDTEMDLDSCCCEPLEPALAMDKEPGLENFQTFLSTQDESS